MDDHIRGEFESRRNPSNGSNPPKKTNSRAGDFKITIDFDDFDSPSQPQRTSPTGNGVGRVPSRSPQSTPRQGKFQVSIPETEKSSAPPKRPASDSVRRTGNAGTGRPSQSAQRPAQSSQRPAQRTQRTTQGAQRQRPNSSSTASSVSSAKRSAQKSASGQGSRRPASKMTKKSKEQRALQRKKTFYSFCACLIVIAIITTTASSVALSTINDILAINRKSAETVSVVVPDGAGFNEVFKAIADSGLIKQKFMSKLFCKFRHYDNYTYTDKETKKKVTKDVEYAAGVYYFESDEGLEAMLESMKASKAGSKETVRVTFPEGWTIAQIFQKIEKYKVCTADKLYANLDIVGKQFGFYEKISANSGRYLKAEGYLFPDTYDFYIGESANSVIKKLFANFEKKWTKEFDQKLKESGMTKDEIIILASIIQREAKDKSQMGDISSVLHNRLNKLSVYPQLQMNSTKDYVTSVNEFGVFTDFYYQLYLDSYNTYSIKGLPPGAICNPGIDAIEAALSPKNTNYYFFCHAKDGTMYLASTAAEHEVNTRKIFNESN